MDWLNEEGQAQLDEIMASDEAVWVSVNFMKDPEREGETRVEIGDLESEGEEGDECTDRTQCPGDEDCVNGWCV